MKGPCPASVSLSGSLLLKPGHFLMPPSDGAGAGTCPVSSLPCLLGSHREGFFSCLSKPSMLPTGLVRPEKFAGGHSSVCMKTDKRPSVARGPGSCLGLGSSTPARLLGPVPQADSVAFLANVLLVCILTTTSLRTLKNHTSQALD